VNAQWPEERDSTSGSAPTHFILGSSFFALPTGSAFHWRVPLKDEEEDLRVGDTKKSLERPYTGSHKIVNRTRIVFDINVNDTQCIVSIKNLKSAYFNKCQA